ncbi:MAG: Holliday junction resolvase RuvX [Actinomycetota bacterium]|nr:Holliday junction resolvase RuvX [Actinomycetota bacterium]
MGDDGGNRQEHALPVGRVVGVDLGHHRVGLAVTDARRTMAVPLATLIQTGDPRRDREALVSRVREEEAVAVVVGLPLSMDGSHGPAARWAAAEAAAIAELLETDGIPVTLVDERLTTVSAHAALRRGGMPGRRGRSIVDQTAATVLLQAFVDGGSQVDAVSGDHARHAGGGEDG